MITERDFIFDQRIANILRLDARPCEKILSSIALGLCVIVLGLCGCGQTSAPVTSAAQDTVNSYFGGPFSVAGSALGKSSSAFDHTTKQIGVSAFISTPTASQVPALIMNGTFAPADTGFLSITENFATTSAGVIAPETPPLTGAWAVEIPGAGALANLLSPSGSSGVFSVSAAPAAMAENTACPNFSDPASFLYVTVPRTGAGNNPADYGRVDISTQGSAVSLSAKPFLVGALAQPTSTVTGGCSITNLGALTAYPIDSFANAPNQELISIGTSGFLVSSYSSVSGTGTGAFGGGAGIIGIAEPSAKVDVNAVIGAKYNGFFYAPRNSVHQNYDITVLASAFGNHSGTSAACSALQSSLRANNGQGAGTVPVLPSVNSIYGGEFLATTTAGIVNDPSGANGSEGCDVAIDLGTQDSTNNGLFPNATIFIGSNYPPFSTSQPWNCSDTHTICSVSFPAAAVVGRVQGQYVIFLVGSSLSSRLPDGVGNRQVQPIGIYLVQKAN